MTAPTAAGQYDALLDVARTVAAEAATLVRERRREGVEVAATKSSATDIVTPVDRAAEKLIHERLTALRPDDGFLGEEGGSSESASGVTWVVDPIDGTVNFLDGIPQDSVSVAASVAGRSVAGVVVDVESGETFAATLGGGATCDGRPLRVRDDVPLEQRLVVTGYHYVPEVRARQADAVAAMLRQVRDVRRLGSAALDLCYLGAGRADAYVEEGLHAWDRAAGGLVAAEAGATVEVREGGGVGGQDLVIAAPSAGFAAFAELVRVCGFVKES
ncbi:MAG: inositol monophosphatase family protein [Nocardioidaceae bacterium]